MQRIAVIADIHGNILALEAVLADIERRGGVDEIINLGDCLSGPLWPKETAARLRALNFATVRGNHDRVLATVAPEAMGPSDRFAYDLIDADDIDWLAALSAEIGRDDMLCVHGTPASDTAFLLDVAVDGRLVNADPSRVANRLTGAASLVLCAHSHRPNIMQLGVGADAVTVINPGSVGAPAFGSPSTGIRSESGSPLARYAVIELAGQRLLSCDHRAIAYDWATASTRAADMGRRDWAVALLSGFMPELVA